jgi:hypothetical protein
MRCVLGLPACRRPGPAQHVTATSQPDLPRALLRRLQPRCAGSQFAAAPLMIIDPSRLDGAAPDCGLVAATVANPNTVGGSVIAVIPSVPGRARIQ